ncbi:hypothetical protein C8J57DRAFT_1310589, partial [Mycena rebaudengoi]
MSSMTSIGQQSRLRTWKNTLCDVELSLHVIVEEEPALELPKGGVKARRRQGVSDLYIPRDTQLFAVPTAVQSPDECNQQSALPDVPTFDLPRASGSSSDSEDSSSSSSSDEGSSSSFPTTPTSSVSSFESSSSPCEIKRPSNDNDSDIEDDSAFYATHLRSFISLESPLPSSFSTTKPRPLSIIIPPTESHIEVERTPSPRRDSAVLPGTLRLSRRISIPSHPPPPPPRSGQLRPAPRTPVPSDVRNSGTDCDAHARASAESPFSAPVPSQVLSPARPSLPLLHMPVQASPLSALLSPAPAFPKEQQGVPANVDEYEEWLEENEGAYEEVPLSPLLVASPSSSSSSSTLPSPTPPSLSPVQHDEMPQSAAVYDTDHDTEYERPRSIRHHPHPQLKSKWSSSTLSSVHSAHAPMSPRGLARRYFPLASPSAFKYPKGRFGSLRGKAAGGAARKGTGKRLTTSDIQIVGRPAAESPVVETVSRKVKWEAPAVLSSLLSPTTAALPNFPTSPSPSSPSTSPFYASHTTAPTHGPRRRASTSSNWSYSSSAHSSDSGCSAASDGSRISGLRRKPIPVEMF